jgi:Ca-activated chloride channel homolog
VKASDVAIYPIGFLQATGSQAMHLRLRLQQIATLSGGQAFFPGSLKELEAMYDKVIDDINARYTLGYASDDLTADGAWRRVQVRVTRPDLPGARIRTRPGYFAPYAPPQNRDSEPGNRGPVGRHDWPE